MKKTHFTLIGVLILALFLCCFSSCSKDEPTPEAEQSEQQMEESHENDDFENPAYDNEEDGAVVKEQASDVSTFIGNWEARSDRAKYLYGNIDLSIKEDGTWTGNLTDEDFSGKWEYNGTGITLSSEIINCDLFQATDGSMMFRDHDDTDVLLVLDRVE